MKLSIIIVNYNVKYFLEQALLSVRKASANLSVEVFVVDNNSVDDSVEMVKDKFPEVKVIANKHNPGFSIANNQAIHQSCGEYVLLLNPDTVVEEDTFQKVIAFMDEHPKAGGLGVKMIDGAGKFLPESKRGFPSPFVAFCKTFGLSKIFPKSKTFNHYHLGYLDKDENHEIEVLSGAFMLLRKSVLDEIGLLDEAFFMYGEDIDLSYRIIKAGYKNYYLADTTIIHYKGESTKKGSLNYVKTFYNAMMIFARKHFEGEKARVFIFMLQIAIYFRAFITLFSGFIKKMYLPAIDAIVIFAGMYFLKDFWANYKFNDPFYYKPSFLYFNVPLYIGIWLSSIYFSGAYSERSNINRLVRGLLVGTLFLLAVYGLLDPIYRTSRMLIILSTIWAIIATSGLRILMHFFKYKNFNIGATTNNNLVIVGSIEESERVKSLLNQVQIQKNFIGTVSPSNNADSKLYLSDMAQMREVAHIYKIDEIIFCSKDVNAQDIMHWMTELGPEIDYKIVPEESLSIIGSSSKNVAGELYTIEIQFKIANQLNKRNKRLQDFLISICLLLISPLTIFFIKEKRQFYANTIAVILGKKSWVGYSSKTPSDLPAIREGVLSPLHGLSLNVEKEDTKRRLDFIYAKEYSTSNDLEIIWKGFRHLGNP